MTQHQEAIQVHDEDSDRTSEVQRITRAKALGKAGRLVAGPKYNRRHYRGSGYYCSRLVYVDTRDIGAGRNRIASWEGWEAQWAEDWQRLQAGKAGGTGFTF